MSEFKNIALLACDALIYFVVLAALFRGRKRFGIGLFFCALGVMHFIETYLAAVFYVSLPFGIVTSPGSSALFTGKLLMLLLVYIREDAAVVRQPIYGLLIGNLLMLALGAVMRHHDLIALAPGRSADFGFLDEMGSLMLWGTALLYIDSILIILLYERTRSWLGGNTFLRIGLCGVALLTFDQIGFWVGLHLLTGAPASVLLGGWLAKMAAVAFYTPLLTTYLVWLERPSGYRRSFPRLSDVFDLLTYRERYEELLARSGRDAITGLLDRGRLESQGRRAVDDAAIAGRPVSLLLVDIDHFKEFNDRFGHVAGDAVLKRIAQDIVTTVRASDFVFRYGGEEFVVICDGLSSSQALALGDRIRRQIAAGTANGSRVTASVGLATCAEDAPDYDALFLTADKRLYQAKAAGRNCVIGARVASTDNPVRLVLAS
jgi:diguanylate cyclase (GGDEF)-like protein